MKIMTCAFVSAFAVAAIVSYPKDGRATLAGVETFPGSSCTEGAYYTFYCPFVQIETSAPGPGGPSGTAPLDVQDIYVDVHGTGSTTAEACNMAYSGTSAVCGNGQTANISGWYEFDLSNGFNGISGADLNAWWDYYYVQTQGSVSLVVNGVGYY